MNQALIDGIEQAIRETQASITQKYEFIQKLEADLEVAKKPLFQPFAVVIQVNSQIHAKILRTLSYNVSNVAEVLEGAAGWGREDVREALDVCLDPLLYHISFEGNYQA